MLKTVNILTPYYSSTIWGGHFLAAQKCWGLDNPGVLLGESWEVSRLENHSAKTLDGRELTDITNGSQIPYLVKFIDTAKHLSIQVHPGDQYAMAHENSSGKSEMWTVLNAKDGAGIYLGFKDGVTKDQFFRTASSEGEVDSLLNFYPVVAGDSFFVPAGAVHAIGAGITLLEVQQSSGITYRVWDWNRLGVD
ncbi:MAG: class I mannose-6-phosphate isomerase, partial [Bdellovibrionales bacterium]|nr:class I mannose-6-phosphate isomerase [Bdellovibrionales bacterium]